MNKKYNLPRLWFLWLLGVTAIGWIIIVSYLHKPLYMVLFVTLAYLLISMILCNAYVYGLLGSFFYFRGQQEKAMKFYKKACDKNTYNVMALHNYGIYLLRENKPKEALKLLERAKNINPSVIMDKNLTLSISSCYWVSGNIDKAIKILEDMIKQYTYVNAHVCTTLGYLYFLRDDYEKAEAFSQRALKDNDEHAPAWDNLGQIYFRKNDLEKAKQYFEKALKFNGNMVDSLYYYGLVLEKEGNKDKAKEYFTKASKTNISALNTVTKEEIEEKLSEY